MTEDHSDTPEHAVAMQVTALISSTLDLTESYFSNSKRDLVVSERQDIELAHRRLSRLMSYLNSPRMEAAE